MVDEWSGLADFLANMIEKYASVLDIDNLPDPRAKTAAAIGKGIWRWWMGDPVVDRMILMCDVDRKNNPADVGHVFMQQDEYKLKITPKWLCGEYAGMIVGWEL